MVMYFGAEFGLSGLKSCGCFSRNKGDRRKEHKMYQLIALLHVAVSVVFVFIWCPSFSPYMCDVASCLV